MAEKKISLIIAGGVSLGAYEAGVLTELLYALEHFNAKEGGDRFQIDVMTGASAGSLTAALVARVLLHDYESKKDLLHEVWVERADIDNILEGTASSSSLLSDDFQTGVIHDLLRDTEAFPLAVVNPAAAAPETLRMAFTISNMVGVDYGLPYAQAAGSPAAAAFPATFFSDLDDIRIDPEHLVDADRWREIGDAALASGSFPVAFPPVSLLRRRDQYPGALATSIDHLPAAQQFVDGGLFNNEPLKPCIALSAEQDGGTLAEDRIFILIDPNLNASKVKREFRQPQNLVANALRVLEMSAGEMTARDWLRVERTNTEIEWRDGLVQELARAAAALPAATIESGLAALRGEKEAIRERRREAPGRGEGDVESALSTIESYHRKAFATVGGDDAASRQEWLRLMVFVLDNAAGLGSKAPLRSLHVIGAEKDLVAGDHLAAFAGFFDETWREHDYRQGRAIAHQRLPGILGVDAYPREGVSGGHNPQYDPDPAWPDDLAEVEIRRAPKRKKKRFRNVVMDQVGAVLRQPPIQLEWYLRWITKWILKKQLNKLLGL